MASYDIPVGNIAVTALAPRTYYRNRTDAEIRAAIAAIGGTALYWPGNEVNSFLDSPYNVTDAASTKRRMGAAYNANGTLNTTYCGELSITASKVANANLGPGWPLAHGLNPYNGLFIRQGKTNNVVGTNITGITKANPCKVTFASNHGLSAYNSVQIAGATGGCTEINSSGHEAGVYVVASVPSATEITLQGIDSTAWAGTYTSGSATCKRHYKRAISEFLDTATAISFVSGFRINTISLVDLFSLFATNHGHTSYGAGYGAEGLLIQWWDPDYEDATRTITVATWSKANPPVLTTATAHHFQTDDVVMIAAATGFSPNPQNAYKVTRISSTSFSLQGIDATGWTGTYDANTAKAWPCMSGFRKLITGVSKASTCRVTCTSHGYASGDIITIAGVEGFSTGGINGTHTITVVDTNNFDLNGINSSGWTGSYTASTGYATPAAHHPHPIVSITQSAKPIITLSRETNWQNGQVVHLYGCGGMTDLNNKTFRLGKISGTQFQILNYDTSASAAYTSGGSARILRLGLRVKHDGIYGGTGAVWKMIYGSTFTPVTGEPFVFGYVQKSSSQTYYVNGAQIDSGTDALETYSVNTSYFVNSGTQDGFMKSGTYPSWQPDGNAFFSAYIYKGELTAAQIIQLQNVICSKFKQKPIQRPIVGMYSIQHLNR